MTGSRKGSSGECEQGYAYFTQSLRMRIEHRKHKHVYEIFLMFGAANIRLQRISAFRYFFQPLEGFGNGARNYHEAALLLHAVGDEAHGSQL